MIPCESTRLPLRRERRGIPGSVKAHVKAGWSWPVRGSAEDPLVQAQRVWLVKGVSWDGSRELG